MTISETNELENCKMNELLNIDTPFTFVLKDSGHNEVTWNWSDKRRVQFTTNHNWPHVDIDFVQLWDKCIYIKDGKLILSSVSSDGSAAIFKAQDHKEEIEYFFKSMELFCKNPLLYEYYVTKYNPSSKLTLSKPFEYEMYIDDINTRYSFGDVIPDDSKRLDIFDKESMFQYYDKLI